MTGPSRKLALFDLDGTLTRKDTLIEIIRYIHGDTRLYLGLIFLSPYLLLFKMGIIANWKAKEAMLTYFFRHMPYDKFQKKCYQFSQDVLPGLIRVEGIKTLKRLREEDARIVIVSASAEEWVLPWCELLSISFIGTRLEVKDGKLTGKISGRNCHGYEKVNRIRAELDLSRYSEIYAYGDSDGDLPMLQLARHAYYRPFRNNPERPI
jgi:HAD superfamily hydrolase (TIGR01490 family)